MPGGIIRTDSIILDGQKYMLADGVVHRRRLFPEQAALPAFQTTSETGISYGDLHPAAKAFPILDFAEGSGLWVDHDKEFSRRAWKSTLDHSQEGVVVLGPRRQSSGTIIRVNFYIHYRNEVYACTDGGLYLYDQGSNTLSIVAGSPTTAFYHATIHNESLVLAGGTATFITFFDGTTFTTRAGNTARVVESLDGYLFAAQNVASGMVLVYHSEDDGVTWNRTIISPNGTPSGIPSPGDPNSICLAPDGNGVVQVHIGTPSGVWIADYRTGKASLLHDMSHNTYSGNASALLFWPSTRKIYVNERTTLVEINPETGETRPVGPDVNAGAPPSLPSGFPEDFRPDYIRCSASNPNYLFIGTNPQGAGDYALIMKMSPDLKWYFVTRVYNAGEPITAMLFGGPTVNAKLYFAEDEPSTTNSLTKFLETDGDYAEEGELQTPWLTFGFPDLEKCLYDLRVEADGLSNTESIVISYQTDYDDTVDTTLTTLSGSSTKPYQLFIGTYPSSIGEFFQAIRFTIKLVRGATTTVTPRVFRFTAKFRLAPPPVYVYDLKLLLDLADNPYSSYLDVAAALETSLEDQPSLLFIPSGDSADTGVPVLPMLETLAQKYDQKRMAEIATISLVEVTMPTAQHGGGTYTAVAAEVCPPGGVLSFAGMTVTAVQTQEDLSFAGMTVGVSVA